MEILVTGSAGLVGSAVTTALSELGHRVRSFDLKHGQDVLDGGRLDQAMTGADAVVHAAALLGHAHEDPDLVFRVNSEGTFQVLQAARRAEVGRVVYLSSVNVLGCFKGEGLPERFPISEAETPRPATGYGMAKLAAEAICASFAETTGAGVIALRPPAIWPGERYARERALRAANPEAEFAAPFEYGAMIDLADMVDAVVAGLRADFAGFHALFVAAAQVASDQPTEDMLRCQGLLARLDPDWCRDDPWRGTIDCRAAERMLGFRATRGWRRHDASECPVI